MQSKRYKLSILIPLFFFILGFLALSIYGLIIRQSTAETFKQQLISQNQDLVILSANVIASSVAEEDKETIEILLDDFLSGEFVLYAAARDTTINIIADARVPGFLPPSQEIRTQAEQAYSQQQITQYEYQNALILFTPIVSESSQVGTLEIAYDLSQTQGLIRQMTFQLILFGLVIFIAGISISILAMRPAATKIKNFVSSAEKITKGDLDVEIPTINLNEFAILGENLEKTRSRLRTVTTDQEELHKKIKAINKYLDTTSSIAKTSSSPLNQQELLTTIVELINNNFQYYLQAIFLLDEPGESVELKASSGEGSLDLESKLLRIGIRQEGIVGHVASTGKLYVSQDVLNDSHYVSDSATKGTRSELSLPLISHENVIGVLDIQSKEIDSFSPEEIKAFQAIADQIAVAISNTILSAQNQEFRNRYQAAFSQVKPEAWSDMAKQETSWGYYGNAEGVVPLRETQYPVDDSGLPELELPISIRGGQVIGRITAHKPGNSDEWNLDEISVMENLVEQLSTAIESAQLFQETKRTASREQLIGDIKSKIRETMDVEAIIKTAAQEIRNKLELPEVIIRLDQNITDSSLETDENQ